MLLAMGQTFAARVDTLTVYSQKMGRKIQVVAVVPDKAIHTQVEKCPVLYLLHGYDGDCFIWLKINRRLTDMADRDGVMIVCPDGENSWYWDSPTKPDSQFETFVAKELVEYIDNHYPTLAHRNGRAITGLSMGGHGALRLAIRHQDVYGACGSTSGGVDLRPFPKSWNLRTMLGEKKMNEGVWYESTVMSQLDRLKDGALAIIFDCGTEDFFHEVNAKLHEALMKRGIHHDYISRPGKHTPSYWRNAIEYQWMYFVKYFITIKGRLE